MAKGSSDKIPVILLFTHMPSTRVFLKRAFGENYYLLEVDDTKEALEKLLSTKIIAMILDDKVREPLIPFLRKVREVAHLKELPILIISSNLKKSYMHEMMTAGATEFLREPLAQEEIDEKIIQAIQTQSIQKKIGPLAKSLSQNLPIIPTRKLSQSRISPHDRILKLVTAAIDNKQVISLLIVGFDSIGKLKEKWDIEGVKEFNQVVEEHLKTLVRPQDEVINTSEDRFIIVLPKTSNTAAKILAEDIEANIKDMKFKLQKGTVRLPFSIGVVSLSEKDADKKEAYNYLEKMLKTGEEDLEKAKRIRSRIVDT